jgi:hypothetical protein
VNPPLLWTKSWRKIYAAKAQELGYQCKWSALPGLQIFQNGTYLATVTPKSREFYMEDIISEAQRIRTEKASAPKAKKCSPALLTAALGIHAGFLR